MNHFCILLVLLNIFSTYSYSINSYTKLSLKSSHLFQSKLNNDISQSSTLMISSDNDDDVFQDKLRKWFLLNYNVRPEIYFASVKDFSTLMNVISESILLSLRVLQVVIIIFTFIIQIIIITYI